MMMETQSEELLHQGVLLSKENWSSFKNHMGDRFASPDHFMTHQVGPAHDALLFQTLSIDKNKSFATYPFLGAE
jgi:3-oxoacyl-[acyl-carrier-protein] synthase-3